MKIYRRIIIRFSVFVLFFLCYSCHNKEVGVRSMELCKQMDSARLYCINGQQKIDSLVKLSVGFSSAERYVVLFHAMEYSLSLFHKEQAIRYLQSFDSLPLPKSCDKATAFLLLDCHSQGNNLLYFSPRLVAPQWIGSLLFDMENRWQLTPQERLRFLVIKSGIYFNIFKEYKSALIIANEGIKLAKKHRANQKMIMDLFWISFQSALQLEEDDQLLAMKDDFIKLSETYQFDSLAKESIYYTFGALYEQQGDYHEAYACLNKTKRMHSGGYNTMYTRIYVGIDSIPAALAYIEKKRKENPHPLILARMAWDESYIHQKQGDNAGYERCLLQSVEIYDRFPQSQNEVNSCAPSEAYARMLWKQGKHSEAIQRMELVNSKLTAGKDFSKSVGFKFHDSSIQINRLRLLRDYYNATGRTADAFRQSLLCDSLEQELAKARLLAERQKTTTATYTMELVGNLELRASEFLQERQKLYFTYSILGGTLLGVVVLLLLYQQRERQLNVLYTRQKEIEQLHAEKQQIVSVKNDVLSPEDQLFKDLEQRFYQEELFRNPGFSRDDLCKLGGSNRMYISTCINKYTGTNINQWINKARIDYAIRLIANGESDLTRLSEQSGFSSIKTFFRSFKQFTNLTPRQYIVREEQKNG